MDNRSVPYENYPAWIIERVLDNAVQKETGCIEYGDGKLKHKYGLISITLMGHRMSVPAHRAMWMAVNRRFDLPSSTQIRHKCDNPCCVNIDHLEPGTSKDNHCDMIARGRRAKKHRAHTRVRVHDDDKIRAIREAKGTVEFIAQCYGVSNSYVSKIRNMKLKAMVK